MATLRLLGSLDLRDAGGRELRQLMGQPKRFALLAYLAGNAPQVYHRRDRLLALFWPESTADQARHRLRQTLYELRNHLGEEAIVRRGDDEIGIDCAILRCDVAELQGALAEGQLERAIELYRGAFLDGFFVSGLPEVESWIERRRAELLRDVVEASWRLAEQRRAAGDRRGASAAAQRAVEWSPTDEAGVRRLLETLHAEGNSGEAMRAYDRLARQLAAEFETEPSAETKAAIAQIRRAAAEAPPDSAAAVPVRPNVGPEVPPTTPAPRWNHPVAAAGLFGLASLGIVSIVNFAVLVLGLPDWVTQAAVGLLIIGLPIIVATALTERRGTAHPWLNWRRALQGGGAAFAGLGLVTAGFMALRAAGVGSVGTLMAKGVLDARDPILLAEFANRTGDSALGATLTNLLRIDLSQSRVVRLVEPPTLAAALERVGVGPNARLDEGLARDVATREGVKAILTGEVSKVGAGYVLVARLIAPDGTLLRAERVTTEDEADLIGATDRLSARLREGIGESLKAIRASPPLDRVTTTSLAALRLYTEAMSPAGLADGQLAGVRLLEQAVELDTAFAMAYRGLGVYFGRIGRPAASRAAIRRAYELRHRLPEMERHLVAATYYTQVEFDAAAITTAYRAVLALDPNSVTALVNLASHQSRARRWAVRESLALRAMAVRAELVPFLNVMNAQLLQGKYVEAEATMRGFARGREPPANWQFQLATAQRDYDRAEQALARDGANADWHRRGDLLRLRGRLGAAARAYREGTVLADRSPPAFVAAYHLASLHADQGREAEAVELMDRYAAAALPDGEPFLLERAELLALLGRAAEARALVAEFERQAGPGLLRHPESRQGLHRVAGELALREGRFDDAVEDFKVVNQLSGQCVTCGLARLADAWFRSGQTDSALAVYQHILAGPTAGLDEDDVRWLPDVYRRLGELFDARGDRRNARRYYAAFVDLWKGADASLQPAVQDARRRMQ